MAHFHRLVRQLDLCVCRYLILPALGFALGTALPTSLYGQTLFESVQTGLESSPSVEAQRLQLSAQTERRIQALSLRRATIQGEATAGLATVERNQQGFNGPSPIRNFDTAPAGVSVTMEQPLYTGGRFDAARSLAEMQIRQAEGRLRIAELEVIQGIVNAWVDVKRDLAIIVVRKETIDALNELLLASQERFRLGEATRTQSAQAEARLAGERASLAVAQANLQASQSNFERFTGSSLLSPGEEGNFPELPVSLEVAVQNARGINPELIVARLEEDLAKARAREVEVDAHGRASMRATVSSDRDQGFAGSRSTSAQIQARYSIPLWSGGATPSRKREAGAQALAARMRALDAERQILARVSTAWGRFIATKTSIEASRQQVSAAMLALRGARAELLYGLGDQLNVLNQQAELASAQIAFIQSERDGLASHYGVLFAIGSLDATSFQARPRPSAFLPESDPAAWEEPLIRVQQKLDPKTRQVERIAQRAIRAVLGPEE
jgi:outer membrane protein